MNFTLMLNIHNHDTTRSILSHLKFPICLTCLFLLLLAGSCSDDIPEPKYNEALYGIYSYGENEFMEIDDLDWIYQYDLEEMDGEKYWIKQKLTYLYEPASELVLRQDKEGILQVDEVISNTSKELTLCWVATPLTEEIEGDSKFEIIRIFFDKNFTVDPANYRTYKRITASELKAGLGDIEVIEAY